ncbi:ribosomal L1 domain-containing protein 1-like [Dendronephthya gigantea]|uniref:ribosomal L1 domain-containing protein 1-like n=1 Tax=Dendronephthya gigantea TaxID=151771 RepID=UPI00106CD136|nr:ribosomal L1 domain-containing protein 1-like [Dendronephthya gigantea]
MAAVRESRLDKNQVEMAVPALLKYLATTRSNEIRLLNENELIWLQLALKKIPQANKKPKRITLPHSLYSKITDVCLLSKEKGSQVKEFLEKNGVHTITKVIPIKKLKTHYKSYESRRQLLAMYDVFLCDSNIHHILPRLLGKEFYRKKKFPIPINLGKKNIAEEINGALQCTLMSVGQGSCSAIRIAHSGMSPEEIVTNIMDGVSEITKVIPRGWANIQSMNIKSSNSIALPIHTSLPDNIEAIEVENSQAKKRKIKDKTEAGKKKKKKVAKDEDDSNKDSD